MVKVLTSLTVLSSCVVPTDTSTMNLKNRRKKHYLQKHPDKSCVDLFIRSQFDRIISVLMSEMLQLQGNFDFRIKSKKRHPRMFYSEVILMAVKISILKLLTRKHPMSTLYCMCLMQCVSLYLTIYVSILTENPRRI